MCVLKSIDSRPIAVQTKELFGHWELDTVKECKAGSSEWLVTMAAQKIVKKL